MSTADPGTEGSPTSLEYARALPPNARTSKLAIIALVTSILGSPCLLVPLSNWINWYVPQQFHQTGRYGYLHFRIRMGAMLLASILSLIAFARIRASHGRLLGRSIALAAIIVSSLWWVMLAMVFVAFAFMGGPG